MSRAPRCGSGLSCPFEGPPRPPSSPTPWLTCNSPAGAAWPGVGEAVRGGGGGGPSKRHLRPDPHLGALDVVFCFERWCACEAAVQDWSEQMDSGDQDAASAWLKVNWSPRGGTPLKVQRFWGLLGGSESTPHLSKSWRSPKGIATKDIEKNIWSSAENALKTPRTYTKLPWIRPVLSWTSGTFPYALCGYAFGILPNVGCLGHHLSQSGKEGGLLRGPKSGERRGRLRDQNCRNSKILFFFCNSCPLFVVHVSFLKRFFAVSVLCPLLPSSLLSLPKSSICLSGHLRRFQSLGPPTQGVA